MTCTRPEMSCKGLSAAMVIIFRTRPTSAALSRETTPGGDLHALGERNSTFDRSVKSTFALVLVDPILCENIEKRHFARSSP